MHARGPAGVGGGLLDIGEPSGTERSLGVSTNTGR